MDGGQYRGGPKGARGNPRPGRGPAAPRGPPREQDKFGGPHRERPLGTDMAATKFKTKVCIYWLRPTGCPYGDKCLFAHGRHEVRADESGTTPGDSPSTNARYKTRMCKHWVESMGTHCPHGVRCTYAHGPTELETYTSIARGEAPPPTTHTATKAAPAPKEFQPSPAAPTLRPAPGPTSAPAPAVDVSSPPPAGDWSAAQAAAQPHLPAEALHQMLSRQTTDEEALAMLTAARQWSRGPPGAPPHGAARGPLPRGPPPPPFYPAPRPAPQSWVGAVPYYPSPHGGGRSPAPTPHARSDAPGWFSSAPGGLSSNAPSWEPKPNPAAPAPAGPPGLQAVPPPPAPIRTSRMTELEPTSGVAESMAAWCIDNDGLSDLTSRFQSGLSVGYSHDSESRGSPLPGFSSPHRDDSLLAGLGLGMPVFNTPSNAASP